MNTMNPPTFRLGRAECADPETRERGAAWAKRYSLEPLDVDSKVSFAIPLISRERAGDWDVVQSLLRTTVRSLMAQTSKNWRAIVCGQDRPDAIDMDPRVEFIPFSGKAAKRNFYDKRWKTRRMAKHVTSRLGEDGYFFLLDADDILHPRCVEYMLSAADRSGYVITRGYMMNLQTGNFIYRGFSEVRYGKTQPFHRICGSSAAVRADTRGGNHFNRVLKGLRKHRDHVHNMAAFGIFLHRVPFPAVIYRINHGENMQERRGNLDNKIGMIERRRIVEEEIADVRREFRLDELED